MPTTFTRAELEAQFNEYLDEQIPTFGFGIHMWDGATTLKAVSPTVYDKEFWNWLDDQDITNIPLNPEEPDVELFAYAREIEEEIENSRYASMAEAEAYDEYQADYHVDDWRSESFGDW